MSSDDKLSALLTNRQRGFITGENELSDRGERAARTRIRERVRQGFLDIELLQKHLDDEDIERVATSFGPDDLNDFGGEELALALRSTVAFAYRLARAGELDAEKVVNDGVQEAKESRIEVLRRRFENDEESLTLGEFSELREAGEITAEEYEEVFRDSLRPPQPGASSLNELADALGDEDVDVPGGGDDTEE